MANSDILAGVVPSYSGGTVRDLHPLPFDRSCYVGGTLEWNEKGCQAQQQMQNLECGLPITMEMLLSLSVWH